jgi:hypothetical protein
MNVLN